MRVPPATAAAIRRFEALTPSADGVVAKKLFGQPAAFVNGNLFFGVFGAHLFVRLAEPDRISAAGTSGFAPFEPMPGRAMREYLVLPGPVLASPARSAQWVARALRYAASLPPKVPSRRVGRSPASRARPPTRIRR